MTDAVVYAKTFSRPDGAIVLADLKRRTMERILPPNASDSELWFLEGQRALVAQIIALIQQGQQ